MAIEVDDALVLGTAGEDRDSDDPEERTCRRITLAFRILFLFIIMFLW